VPVISSTAVGTALINNPTFITAIVDVIGTPTITIGTTTTLPAGSPATAVNVGTPSDVIINFGIPQGIPGTPGTNGTNGIAATIAVGTVVTGAPGSLATVVNAGTSSAAIFNFSIPQGLSGPQLDYASFGALMPGDNAATIAVGAPILFPSVRPARAATGITALTSSTFNLAAIGDYDIYYQASITEPGQLGVVVNGTLDPYSVAGRAGPTTQISNKFTLRTTVINTVISVNNPAGNATALTLTPIAGGTHSVSAQLVITRLA
jgi:hypothetical protein